jgi:hypothetical protein
MAVNFSHKKNGNQNQTQINGDSPDSHKVVKQGCVENAEEWEKLILFYRSHLDIFIEEYFSSPGRPVEFKDVQKIVARNCGNCTNVIDIESRSFGKTWKMAWILSALAILYSDNRILVVSGNVSQAMLVANYIRDISAKNEALAREINLPVKISKDGATIKFKNNSTIICKAMEKDGKNIVGLREKIIYIDESWLIKSTVIQKALRPMLSYTRDVAREQNFEDFDSKLFETSSAYLKTCDMYKRFVATVEDMKNGNMNKFACALNYEAGIRTGIIKKEFVEEEKSNMLESIFDMEWGAKFIGNQNGSFFPYDLTEPCRNMPTIELKQPARSKSRYILSLDVATSEADGADLASIVVVKFVEKNDGTFHKYVVYIRTFHGYSQEKLAEEVRKTCLRFSNIESTIIDGNAIGEGVVSLLNFPYVCDNVEYKPFVRDDIGYTGNNAIPIIRFFRGSNDINNRMVTKTKLYFENGTLHLPIPSSEARRLQQDSFEDSSKKDISKPRELLLEELAIYFEVDKLQFELSTIVPKLTPKGNTFYDTALSTQHKDRCSSLWMAMDYISQLEEENRDKYNNNNGNQCWGMATTF